MESGNSAEAGVAKLREIQECMQNVARDASKFFDKGEPSMLLPMTGTFGFSNPRLFHFFWNLY